MQLFYNSSLHKNSIELNFDTIESRHIVKVLRKKEGDIVYITNGKNLLFKGAISSASEKKCQVQIIEVIPQKQTRNYRVSIAIAPTKNNARFEWFLEKATEIGVDEIYPIICKHSERRVLKLERMQKIIQTAMKQSLQYKLPTLNNLISFKDLISKNTGDQKLIALCEFDKNDLTRNRLFSQIKTGTDVLILIGPEGGFSVDEIKLALQNSFIPVSLGATRLRTETAGIAAVHTISLKNE